MIFLMFENKISIILALETDAYFMFNCFFQTNGNLTVAIATC